MPTGVIEDPIDPRLADYRIVQWPALLARRGLFIAEGRLVVRTLLASRRFHVRSLLVTEAALASLDDLLDASTAPFPVYVGSKTLMSGVIGFNVHRGCLAIGERAADEDLDTIVPPAPAPALAVVLEEVANADNIGGIFRNAAAFGVDAVVLSPGCCDPLYRKAVRVSIGRSLVVPFTRTSSWTGGLARLRELGFTVLALTPGHGASDIDADRPPWSARPRLALLAGTEGSGLTDAALQAADWRVRIPMVPGADSLNVATAVGIALHRLSRRVERLQGAGAS